MNKQVVWDLEVTLAMGKPFAVFQDSTGQNKLFLLARFTGHIIKLKYQLIFKYCELLILATRCFC